MQPVVYLCACIEMIEQPSAMHHQCPETCTTGGHWATLLHADSRLASLSPWLGLTAWHANQHMHDGRGEYVEAAGTPPPACRGRHGHVALDHMACCLHQDSVLERILGKPRGVVVVLTSGGEL
jgi:hypothetical protein